MVPNPPERRSVCKKVYNSQHFLSKIEAFYANTIFVVEALFSPTEDVRWEGTLLEVHVKG